MELLLGMLWLAGVAWAAKNALNHAGAAYRKSRANRPAGQGRGRHAVAWWTREAGKGFPVTRAGFHRGWLAHQTAMAQHHAKREEARTSHLEARASIATELRQHRERQAEAQARIDQAAAPPEDDQLTRLREARAALADNAQAEKAAGVTEETPEFQRLNTDVVNAEQAVPWRHRGATPKAVPPSQEGKQHMATATDTNYTESLRMAKEVEAEADAAVNDIRWQQMSNQVDSIGALMRGDTATLSDASDVADALAEQKKAMEQTRDSAQAFASNLQRRHGGIKEAHDDAPVPAAESEFYEE